MGAKVQVVVVGVLVLVTENCAGGNFVLVSAPPPLPPLPLTPSRFLCLYARWLSCPTGNDTRRA